MGINMEIYEFLNKGVWYNEEKHLIDNNSNENSIIELIGFTERRPFFNNKNDANLFEKNLYKFIADAINEKIERDRKNEQY